MNNYQKQYVVPAIVIDEYHPELQQYLPDGIQEMHLTDVPAYVRGLTVYDLAREYGLKAFDTALPQGWLDDVTEKTGFDIRGHVVWSYDESTVFGAPFALTREGRVALDIYDHITG